MKEQDVVVPMFFFPYYSTSRCVSHSQKAKDPNFYYNAASFWSCQISKVRKSRRQSVTSTFLFPRFPYRQAKNVFFHLHLPVISSSTTNLFCIKEQWRCHANDTFLSLPFEGQFKLSSWSVAFISDAQMYAYKYCKWTQCRSEGISFLKI